MDCILVVVVICKNLLQMYESAVAFARINCCILLINNNVEKDEVEGLVLAKENVERVVWRFRSLCAKK